MATNILSKTRSKYIKITEFAEQYGMSRSQAYKLLALPIFSEAVIKIGKKGKRINREKAFEIMQQIYN